MKVDHKVLLYVEAGKIYYVSVSNLEFEMLFHIDAVRSLTFWMFFCRISITRSQQISYSIPSSQVHDAGLQYQLCRYK